MYKYIYTYICMCKCMCVCLYMLYVYVCIYWRLGGESACDPNREIDFGFVFVHVSCVRAKLCAMIPLWLGAAKLFSPAAPPPAAAAAPVGGRTSRDVPSIKIINVTFFIRKKSEQKRPVFPVKNFAGSWGLVFVSPG